MERSATGLSSLPPDAQGPISAALGKDDSGYWVHRSAAGFRGENRRHALMVEFTNHGAEIRGEARSGVRSQNLRWALETRAYGYGDAVHPLKAIAPKANANRVEYRRNGVTEWYENGPLGLEQGFTLAHPPGRENGQPLTVELRLRGSAELRSARTGETPVPTRFSPVLEPGGKGLELRGNDGEVALRYTGLKARDATGRELRSWLEVRGEWLLVRVDDRGARYPVVLDPWILQAVLTASDGTLNDGFGVSVALSGSTVVVGAPCHTYSLGNCSPGTAYVFVESGGVWRQQEELTASDGAANDDFGRSVSLDGSTAVVGAPGHTVGSNQNQGAAYVFVESGGVWKQQAELTASDGAATDYFGSSVAVSGSTALVGASCHPYSTSSQSCGPGAAYVFVESGGRWGQQAELTASDVRGR